MISQTTIRANAMFILLSCFTLLTANSFAQNNAKVTVAGLNSNEATVDQILSNPVLTSSLPDSRVSSFSITLVPKGRFLIGPYKIDGDRITQRAKDSLNSVAGKPVTIVFEDIKINKNGKEMASPALIMKCKQ